MIAGAVALIVAGLVVGVARVVAIFRDTPG